MGAVTAEFPETRWLQLLELKAPGHPRYAEQLDRLARAQQFFAMLLGRGDLERASPERGSSRGFLQAAGP